MLHLMSNKLTTDTTAFDQKWNQLMPRRPQVAKVAPQPQQQQQPVQTIDSQLDPLKLTEAKRPAGFNQGFAELNPSLLGNAGSLESELEPDLAPIHRNNGPGPTSPLNNMSLDAEFSVANARMKEAGDGLSLSDELGKAVENKEAVAGSEVVPGNELSLAAELSQVNQGSSDESGEEDVIEIHTEEEEKIEVEEEGGKNNAGFEEDEVLSPVRGSDNNVKIVVDSPELEGQKQNNEVVTTPKSEPTSSAAAGFTTSTPIKAEVSVSSSTKSGLTTESTSFYQSALSQQNSTEDEPSILGQRKFAACLQTVVTSFDGDELDPMSFKSFSSNSSVEEEVFKIPHPETIPEEKQAEEQANNSNAADGGDEDKAAGDTVDDAAVADTSADSSDQNDTITIQSQEEDKTKEEEEEVASKPELLPDLAETKLRADSATVDNSASPLLDLADITTEEKTENKDSDGLTS